METSEATEMKIGDLAEQSGVSVQTVRFYERGGLLPKPPRTRSGYRESGVHAVHRLRFIRRAKERGFTLTEVAELLDLRVDPHRTADDVRERALLKIRATQSKIRDLKRIQQALQRLVDRCEAHGSPDECALMHAIGDDEPIEGGGDHEHP
ncbi:MAG: MerR family DNA-binding transcriptional regulator [Gemmatimonadetes bacterium]|nr:MerR family DNA-binding transcriptional regulator [Gemmatimonadota bacterium]